MSLEIQLYKKIKLNIILMFTYIYIGLIVMFDKFWGFQEHMQNIVS